MKTGDKVTRKWKPELGEGVVLHALGDKIVVKWYGLSRPLVNFEQLKYLKIINESR